MNRSSFPLHTLLIPAVRSIRAVFFACLLGVGLHAESLDRFVPIKGGTLLRGPAGGSEPRDQARIEDFEILDHPVTNAEYKQFVDATNFPAPLHWEAGRIPAGKEDYPVIFVNRSDVRAFLQWLSTRDGRTYRLPLASEFEYAASGGPADRSFPWGEAAPEGRANFDVKANRRFDCWADYLEPARSREPNSYGLYGMAGNVWQMAITRIEMATAAYRYRVEDADILETAVLGGSWARSGDYLRRGMEEKQPGGMRVPDMGFRPVRAPQGQNWSVRPRRLTALAQGQDSILLSWSLLRVDEPGVSFNVYRASSRVHDSFQLRDHAGFLVSSVPVGESTVFLDRALTPGQRYHYYVRPVDRAGHEGPRSEWIGATAGAGDGMNVIARFAPVSKPGTYVPVFGDLNGDGAMDCVIRLGNGNEEASQDPGVPVQLEAFTSWGRSLWRKDVCFHDHCFGNHNNVPFNVWDMDGDGRAEVITLLQQGDELFVAILDGLTGKVKHQTPWKGLASDLQKSSTRVELSVACLDGKNPAVVTQAGIYENEVLTAYDSQLKQLWEFKSFGATSGSGGHKIEAADVDGDGRQEIFDGTTCLNSDGTLRWSIYRMHPDLVSIHDYLPARPGLEVCYVVESQMHAGIYMVDANTGEVIWKQNREDNPVWTHGHTAWTSDIWDGSPGLETITNRAGHADNHFLMFGSAGKLLLDPFPSGFRPFEWDGDATRELLKDNGRFIGDFDGQQVVRKAGVQANFFEKSSLIMTADLYGDFRDELVLSVPTAAGGREIVVVMATDIIPFRYEGALEDREYRLWIARNKGGGYSSIFDRVLTNK